MKGYRKISFYLFDIGLFNSYIWKEINKETMLAIGST